MGSTIDLSFSLEDFALEDIFLLNFVFPSKLHCVVAVLEGNRLSAKLELNAGDAVVDLLLVFVADGLPSTIGIDW